MARLGTDIEKRIVRHVHGLPMVEVGGLVGCYVRIQATPEHKGSAAKDSFMLLTPVEARDLAYQLRVMADLVDEGRTPGLMR